MKKIILIICIYFLANVGFASVSLNDEATLHRFQKLTSELRCLVCQNQNIAESNAPLANDLRAQIYEQIENGNTDKDIVDYLVSRYGDFILYKPPFNYYTYALWFGPFIFLIAGLIFLFNYLRKNKSEY